MISFVHSLEDRDVDFAYCYGKSSDRLSVT